MTKDIQKKETKSNIMTTQESELLEASAGSGTEELTMQEQAIPRLTILQKLSKQLDANEPEYIEKARAGMIFDSVSQELYSGTDGVIIIPVKYTLKFIEWKLRKNGGGFVADHGANRSIEATCTRDENNRYITKNGTEIQKTCEYFCIMLTGKNPRPVSISMSRSQLKIATRFNSIVAMERITLLNDKKITPPLFYRYYRLFSQLMKKNEDTWYGIALTPIDQTLHYTPPTENA